MPDLVLLALRRNLANAELMGDAARAKRIKARIASHEKAAAPEPSAPIEPEQAAPATEKKAAKAPTKKAAKSAKKGN